MRKLRAPQNADERADRCSKEKKFTADWAAESLKAWAYLQVLGTVVDGPHYNAREAAAAFYQQAEAKGRAP